MSVNAENSYTVGISNIDYWPVWRQDADGQFIGRGPDLLNHFAQSQGFSFVFVPLPLKRAVDHLINGEVDFKFPDNPNWDLTEKADRTIFYSAPMMAYTEGVMVPAHREGTGLSSLHIIGAPLGFPIDVYRKRIDNGQLYASYIISVDTLLTLTLRGRTEGAYLDVDVATSVLNKMGKEDALIFDKSLPHVKDHYYLSSIKYPVVMKAFNTFLAEQQHLSNPTVSLK